MAPNDVGSTGIGAAVRRREDFRFLTGRGTYTDDINRPNQTHAVLLRSPHAHATIVAVDTAAAKASPGVVAIYTGADFQAINGLPCGWMVHGKNNTPMVEPKHPILADGKAADERLSADTIRDAKVRLEKETNRELERLQHDNRLQILSAKNKAIDEVFKRVNDKLSSLSDSDYIDMVGKWLGALPADVGGTLRVNPRDEAKFNAGLDVLNRNRGGNGRFTQVVADARVSSGATDTAAPSS